MCFVFVLIIAAPLIVHTTKNDKSFLKSLRGTIGVQGPQKAMMALLQPLDAGLNDTRSYYTGSYLPKGYSPSSASPLPVTTGNYNDLRKLF